MKLSSGSSSTLGKGAPSLQGAPHLTRLNPISGLLQSSVRLPDCPIFLAASPDGGVHSPLGQFPRLAQMTAIRLGVGCERQSKILFGLARKPLLLFRHRSRIRSEEGKSVESVVEREIIQLFVPAPRG